MQDKFGGAPLKAGILAAVALRNSTHDPLNTSKYFLCLFLVPYSNIWIIFIYDPSLSMGKYISNIFIYMNVQGKIKFDGRFGGELCTYNPQVFFCHSTGQPIEKVGDCVMVKKWRIGRIVWGS